jgi:hypothetical protein
MKGKNNVFVELIEKKINLSKSRSFGTGSPQRGGFRLSGSLHFMSHLLKHLKIKFIIIFIPCCL